VSPHNAIAALTERYGLGAGAGERLRALVAIVAEERLAPTTVRDPDRIIDDHLADSLVALELPEVRHATQIADLGAGAGFPGLPLAVALPSAAVALVESSARKCAFIARAASACGAANARVVHSRAEEWRDGLGACDLVVARALAAPEVIAEYAAPLLRIGGAAVLWRGRRDPGAETAAARAAQELGLAIGPVIQVHPYPGVDHRHLHVFTKVEPTPDRFPRRAGIARKRPLGHGI
jgi:16S rRNA (guanine527-N7)-methyltransferase